MTNPRLWQPQDDAVTIMNRMGSECERLADEFVKLKTEESAAESTKLMTPAEAAEYFQVSESLIKRQAPEMESAGLAVHIGKQWRFKRV